jgi:hypothetical protein
MNDNNDLMRILFAELIEELGGIVKLDACKIKNTIENRQLKSIGIKIDNNVVIVEVFDEDED